MKHRAGSSIISSLDATRILLEVVGIDRPEIPPLPELSMSTAVNQVLTFTGPTLPVDSPADPTPVTEISSASTGAVSSRSANGPLNGQIPDGQVQNLLVIQASMNTSPSLAPAPDVTALNQKESDNEGSTRLVSMSPSAPTNVAAATDQPQNPWLVDYLVNPLKTLGDPNGGISVVL